VSKRSNIEFMIAWLDALRRGDREAAAAALHPAVVWQGMRPEWGCDEARAQLFWSYSALKFFA